MSRNIRFTKGSFIVIQNPNNEGGFYWTVVNKQPPKIRIDLHDFHCHLPHTYSFEAAKMLAIWGSRITSGRTHDWPIHYPRWLQQGLSKLLYGTLEAYIMINIEPKKSGIRNKRKK